MKRALLMIIIATMAISWNTNAQKIKYKDLYLILEAKKYNEAEPFLKTFLKNSKNADHPNANFQMALMFQSKAYKNDVLVDDSTLLTNVDSALIFYQKALQYIGEKEVKRNSEYYRSYQRRDVRTGKFGVKLTDVQFDIEKRQKALNSRKERVVELNKLYQSTSEGYNKAFDMFAEIRKEFDTEKRLYLQSNDELIENLGELEKTFTKVIQDFNKFKNTLAKIPKSGYDPSLQLREILNYDTDGKSQSSLVADNVDLWDFGKWAEKSRDRIKQEIYPLRDELIAFDQNLNRLEAKMKSDSVSLADQIKSTSGMTNKLKEWDNQPLPVEVFKLKTSRLQYLSHQIANNGYKDSTDIFYQQKVVDYSLSRLKEIDSLANLLIGRDITEEGKYYVQFVTKQFESNDKLQAYIKSQIDFSIENKRNSEEELLALKDRMNWLIDENDSIPVFDVGDTLNYAFQPILIEENLTTGLHKKSDNSLEGYFTQATPERTTRTKTFFKVNGGVFNFANLDKLQSKVIDDGEGDIFYVLLFSDSKIDSSYSANLSKIYSSDGLAWEKEMLLDAIPQRIELDNANGDIIITKNLENFSGDLSTVKKEVVIDKKGNIRGE